MKIITVGFLLLSTGLAFQLESRPEAVVRQDIGRRRATHFLFALNLSADAETPPSDKKPIVDLSDVLTDRLPTSVDDQIRQASESLKRATQDGLHRHCVRLLLPVPVENASELDDWPGGARQMMEAADPLVENILKGLGYYPCSGGSVTALQRLLLDASDGVVAVMAQAQEAKDDSCTVLLPTADTITALRKLEGQVGPHRNLIVVNPQWRRRSDFGGGLGFFGGGRTDLAAYGESFVPTFSLTNLICEGENIRILRSHPGPWRVFMRKVTESNGVDWVHVGSKDFEINKPAGWEKLPETQRDGGKLYDYGQPTFSEIVEMLNSSPSYTPKNPAERAVAAFSFIKDSL